MERVRRSTDNCRLEMRINLLEDVDKFYENRSQERSFRCVDTFYEYRIRERSLRTVFHVSVFPNGFDKENEGWIEVALSIKSISLLPQDESQFVLRKIRFDYGILSCTVSVTDIEGNSRFPRCVVEIPYERWKYLERSAILKREDEFLPEGVLTVRCDIHFYFDTIFSEGLTYANLRDFLTPIPKKLIKSYDIQNSYEGFTVYDFTHQSLTFPPRESSILSVYGDLVSTPSFSGFERNTHFPNILEHVWMFEVENVRFLLCLDERQDSVGTRLLKASPVIRGMVSNRMKEWIQKRIPFPDTSYTAFIAVLFFLEKGALLASEYQDSLKVYEFSHFHEMKELQRKCADQMVKGEEFSTARLKTIADKYSDEYLTKMLESRVYVSEDSAQSKFGIDERLNFECYL